MARRTERQPGRSRNDARPQRAARHLDNEGIIPVLARAVREVEAAVERGALKAAGRAKFQAIAVVAREERARVKAAPALGAAEREAELKRLDGIATILAKSAVRDAALFRLLDDDATVSDAVREVRREMLQAAGLEQEEPEPVQEQAPEASQERRVVPRSVVSRQLSNPFLTPDPEAARVQRMRLRRLAGWELIEPLLQSFEYAGAGAVSCMALPAPSSPRLPDGRTLMRHQAEVVAAAAAGHRTFLLADEPGLGKTAQALLAAQAADAYPLLVVVPNVVKANWAREAAMWTPNRRATVIHGDGEDVDGFADIVVVNYEILDRHVGWMGGFGFRGMVVDEAHYIKNRTSQRSRHVLHLSERIRQRTARPLLMALTGTPLINDIEDFKAIWQFLGWTDGKQPIADLAVALEDVGLTPEDPGFYAAARQSVIDRGIVRRRKVDVAKDIPARRIADIPVELDGEAGRSLLEAERSLARRMLRRYDAALASRAAGPGDGRVDLELVRRVAGSELQESRTSGSSDNVFAILRRIGRAKADLAAEYTAELARSAGKVVFFARHLDVLDAVADDLTRRGLRLSSIRGDQTPAARAREIEAFQEDPDVPVILCSITAAGVGVNLQVASDVVLAELPWTDAQQTQAIDRVHRIGQDQPVTAWRIIAAQTLDTRIAALIADKAGLAARALDGSDEEVAALGDVQLEALVAILAEALERRGAPSLELVASADAS